jgi:DegV family protein with EDD domain
MEPMARTVAVVTDSTCDLPADRVEQLGIHVVPLVVRIDDVTYQDGTELSPAAYYEKLGSARSLPTTSQPSMGRFKAAYEKIEADDVVSIHISGKLSGTVGSARAAAEQLPGKRIRVIDSQAVSLAMGYIAQAAAETALAGATFEEVGASAEGVLPRAGFYAVLDTLQHAQRSGRKSAPQALVGSVLQVKPIIALRGGAIESLDKPRTMRKAAERLFELSARDAPFGYLGIAHAANEPLAHELAERLASIWSGTIDVVTTGAVIGTHCGPGAAAICYIRK